MTVCQSENDKVSALTFDETAAGLARRLEDRERIRCGVTLPVARASVARRVGVAPGTLERLRAGRIKGVREWIASALRGALIAELEAEIGRAEHELTILRASDRRIDRSQVAEVEAGLASLRRTLSGEGDADV